MISIIVSSYRQNVFEEFSDNVKKTIGKINYEIIQVNNPGLMGICQAYNKGAAEARYPYLIFSHEDILFHTNNWGSIINEIFEQDNNIGLVGCAGGLYKSYLHTGWAVDENYISSYMIGTHYGASHVTKTYKGISRSLKLNDRKDIPECFKESKIVNEEVLMLDGMFLATRKGIHEKVPFDQETFKKFHCYDLDYSFQIKKYYKVIVNHNILIEHFSIGNFDTEWLEEMKKFNKKWKSILPFSLNHISSLQQGDVEFKSFETIMRIHIQNKIFLSSTIKMLFQKYYIKKLGIVTWMMLLLKVCNKFSCKSVSVLSKGF